MSNVIKEIIIETIKAFSEQEIILYLVDIFEGREETILEYVRMSLLIN